MATTAHRALDHVERTNVSQATRADAKPPTAKYSSYTEEWNDLIAKRRDIEYELGELGRKASRDNIAIRAKHGNANSGFAEWQAVKGKIEAQQLRLRNELHAIEERCMAIKGRVREEKQRRADEANSNQNQLLHAKLDQIVERLDRIEKVLRETRG